MTLPVEKDNSRAQALYLRRGFVVIGETDEELLMRGPAPSPPEIRR